MKYQQEAGHPLSPRSVIGDKKQHCPLAETHSIGPPHSAMAIKPIPAAPAAPTAPTSPRPPSIGAIPPAPRAPRAPAPATLPATPLTARRAKPPGRMREESDNYSEIFTFKKVNN